jgi:hypothetical protein
LPQVAKDLSEPLALAATPQFAQRALRALSASRFFAGLSERAFVGSLKQVSAYFGDRAVREEARALTLVGPCPHAPTS